jgi:hypothetical protein
MSDYLIMNLPQDLIQATEEQHEEIIIYLVSLPLKELRQRQSLVREQQTMARAEALRSGTDTRLERAMSNLQVMDGHLFRAVFRQTFGEDPGWPLGSPLRIQQVAHE